MKAARDTTISGADWERELRAARGRRAGTAERMKKHVDEWLQAGPAARLAIVEAQAARALAGVRRIAR